MDRDLSQIAAWMQAAGIAEIELRSNGKAIRMQIGGTGEASVVTGTPAAAVGRHIRSTGIGTLLLAHPLRKEPLVKAGDAVKQGDVVALLQVGPAYLPVKAPSDGVIGAVVAEAGTRVGFGSPIFELV
jgi:acetyl-CoA carboxylase biotin carboxyl carrier protein